VNYRVVVGDRVFEIEIGPGGRVWVNRRPFSVDLEGFVGLPQYSLLVDHRSYETHVEAEEEGECRVMVAGRLYRTRLRTKERSPAKTVCRRPKDGPEAVCAPLPGLLVDVRVVEGQQVEKGEVVAVLETMKMHLELRAPRSGVVHTPHTAGRDVAQGEVLAVIGRPSAQDSTLGSPHRLHR